MAEKVGNEEETLAYGREILQGEAHAVLAVCDLLDNSFCQAVSRILEMPSQGRVIVSGMGKAGFVAMKLSATFASTGVPSFFLHPAEAVHGDLGRYTKDDLALVLSNSGETEEIIRMLPHVKRIGCPIIVMTGNEGSSLAQHADVVLTIGKVSEAGPMGLAPTTSTTVMLALGDALAMAVLHKQDFTQEQFALYHPGGNLGRILRPVSELMRHGDEHCVVAESDTTREVLHRYSSTKGRPGAASIVDGQGRLSGIFTDGNLRRCLDDGTDFLDQPVREVMTRNPKAVKESVLAADALRVLAESKIDQLVVVDDQLVPVGMLDIQDLVLARVVPTP